MPKCDWILEINKRAGCKGSWNYFFSFVRNPRVDISTYIILLPPHNGPGFLWIMNNSFHEFAALFYKGQSLWTFTATSAPIDVNQCNFKFQGQFQKFLKELLLKPFIKWIISVWYYRISLECFQASWVSSPTKGFLTEAHLEVNIHWKVRNCKSHQSSVYEGDMVRV